LVQMEKQYIFRVLNANGGKIAKAASILGISRDTLRRRMRTYKYTYTAPVPQVSKVKPLTAKKLDAHRRKIVEQAYDDLMDDIVASRAASTVG
jgi:transposase